MCKNVTSKTSKIFINYFVLCYRDLNDILKLRYRNRIVCPWIVDKDFNEKGTRILIVIDLVCAWNRYATK